MRHRKPAPRRRELNRSSGQLVGLSLLYPLLIVTVGLATICLATSEVAAQPANEAELQEQRQLDASLLRMFTWVRPALAETGPSMVAGACAAAERVAARGENAPGMDVAPAVCAAAVRGMIQCGAAPFRCGLSDLYGAEPWSLVLGWLEYHRGRGLPWGEVEARGAAVINAQIQVLRTQHRAPAFNAPAGMPLPNANPVTPGRPAVVAKAVSDDASGEPVGEAGAETASDGHQAPAAAQSEPTTAPPLAAGVTESGETHAALGSPPSRRVSRAREAPRRKAKPSLPARASSAPSALQRDVQAICEEGERLLAKGRGEMARLREAMSDDLNLEAARECGRRMRLYQAQARTLRERVDRLPMPNNYGGVLWGFMGLLELCVSCSDGLAQSNCPEVAESIRESRARLLTEARR
jgi:hypothetical protein